MRKTTVSFFMSVCPSTWNISAPTGWIFIKFDKCVFFETLSRNVKFNENLTRIMGSCHHYLRTFMITSRRLLLVRMRNVTDKICRGSKQIFKITFLQKIVPFMR